MVVYETTRAKTAFDAFASASTSSTSFHAVTDGIGYVQDAVGTYSESYSHANNQTVHGKTEGGGGGFTGGTGFSSSANYGGTSTTAVNASGSTYSHIRTGQTVNSSTVLNGTTTASGLVTFETTSEINILTSATTYYDVTLRTSSSYTDTEIPFAETSTRTVTRYGLESIIWVTEGDYSYAEPFTVASTSAVTVTTFTNLTVNGPYEIGTVVEGDDVRLYSFSDSQSFGFPNDSFTKQTFWADSTESIVEFTTYTVVPTVSFTNTADTFADVAASLSLTSMVVTVVTGWNIPHGTTTTFGQSVVATNYTFSGGISSNTGTGNVTYSSSYTAPINTTTTVTVLAFSGVDRSTYTLATASTRATTYSRTSSISPADPFRSHYLVSSTYYTVNNGVGTASIIHATNASGFGISKAATKTTNFQTVAAVSTGGVEIFQPVPLQGGRKSPQSMEQSDGTGTNLSFAHSIYYPFYSSVQSNVGVPVKRNGTAVTGSTTWRYKWESFTLKYTTKNSLTSGTGSGEIGTAGAQSAHGWKGVPAFPAVAGGFAPITTASALLLMKPGGHGITSYNSAGSSTTAKTILTAFSTVQIAQTAEVISALPVVSVSTGMGGGGAAYVTFTRN